MVVKYYLTGYKCLAKRRSTRAMRMFQNGVYSWMLEEVIPLLGDEEIYTVFGGVLRVLATLKRLGELLYQTLLFYQISLFFF